MALLFESFHLEFFIGIVTMLSVLYVYLTWNFDYWKKKGVPFVEPILFFGSTKDAILGRIFGPMLFKRIYDEYDGHKYVGVYQFREPALMLRDPEIIKDVLVKNFASFHDRGLPTNEEAQPLTAHLFSLPGKRWRAVRTMLTPTFTSGKMKMMYQLMEECCDELRKVLDKSARLDEEIELRELMAQLTTDIIGSCAFGLQMNAMKDSKSRFREMGRKAFRPSITTTIRILTLIYLNPLAKLLKVGYADSEVEHFFLNLIMETIKHREENNIIRNDFIHLWIQLKNKGKFDSDGKKSENNNGATNGKTDSACMTDKLIAAQAFLFFLAGFETSSSVMSFTVYELALYPEVQQKLRDEIDTKCQENGGKLSYEVIHNMPYMDMVVSETLRKYPPLGCLIRICTKPYTIPGTDITVGKDIRLVIPAIAIQNDPKIYPDPHKFDPERFTEEAKASRHPYMYLPFGEGPRICIGKRFGLMQAKLGLATLLRHYQFSTCKRTVFPIRFDPTSFPTASKDGLYLKISPRD